MDRSALTARLGSEAKRLRPARNIGQSFSLQRADIRRLRQWPPAFGPAASAQSAQPRSALSPSHAVSATRFSIRKLTLRGTRTEGTIQAGPQGMFPAQRRECFHPCGLAHESDPTEFTGKRGIRVLCCVQTGTRNSTTSRQGVTETIPGRCGSSSRAPPPSREVGKRLRKTRPSGLRSSARAGLPVACRQLRASPFTPLGRVHIVPGNRAGPEGAPACKHPKRLARPGGLEPPTCGLEVRCSIQLS